MDIVLGMDRHHFKSFSPRTGLKMRCQPYFKVIVKPVEILPESLFSFLKLLKSWVYKLL